MVLLSVRLPALMASTSAPAVLVSIVAVDSPGRAGVIKRDTSTVVESAVTETWRGLLPTASVATVLPVAGSSLSNCPVASSTT